MKHVVILFDEQDEQVAERLEKAMALMQHRGEVKTYSRLHILPGENVLQTIDAQIAKSEVSIIVLSIDLNQDVLFDMIERYKEGLTDLLVVYANYVEDELLNEFYKHKIPVTPIMPISGYPNKDAAYRKISLAIRKQLGLQHHTTSVKRAPKKQLLVLLAARRNLQNE